MFILIVNISKFSGVDAIQQHVLGQGPQDNESALEQAKDEKISDCMSSSYPKVICILPNMYND